MSNLRFCMLTTFYPPYNFGGDGIGPAEDDELALRCRLGDGEPGGREQQQDQQ